MAIITTSCPHPPCGGMPVSLTVVRNLPQTVRGNVISYCVCPRCELPVSVVLKPQAGEIWTARSFTALGAHDAHDLVAASGWKIDQVFPAPPVKGAPELTPPDIARVYRQAHTLLRKGECEAAVYLFGRVLEQSFKCLGMTDGSFLDRIDLLTDSGSLRFIQEWAREIGMVTSGPAGLSDVGEPDVRAAAEFTEAFLITAFTLRSKFEARQSCRLAASASVAAE